MEHEAKVMQAIGPETAPEFIDAFAEDAPELSSPASADDSPASWSSSMVIGGSLNSKSVSSSGEGSLSAPTQSATHCAVP